MTELFKKIIWTLAFTSTCCAYGSNHQTKKRNVSAADIIASSDSADAAVPVAKKVDRREYFQRYRATHAAVIKERYQRYQEKNREILNAKTRERRRLALLDKFNAYYFAEIKLDDTDLIKIPVSHTLASQITNYQKRQERIKIWKEANKETARKQQKMYRDSNKLIIKERNRIYYDRNKIVISHKRKKHCEALKEAQKTVSLNKQGAVNK